MIKVKPLLVSVAVLAALPSFAQAQSLEDRIRQLESQIGVMESTPGQGAGGSVELYGSLRTQLQYQDQEVGTADDSSTDVTDAASRIGIRATSDMGNGWKATARGEWKVQIGEGAGFGDGRLAYVQLAKDGLGAVAIGQQWTGFYNFVGAVTDVANDGTPGGYNLVAGVFRASNMVTYTNKFAGLVSVQVDTQFDGDTDNDTDLTNDGRDNLDRYAVSAGVNLEGVQLAASYDSSKADSGDSTDLLGLAAGYAQGPYYVGLSYTSKDTGGTAEPSAIDLSGTYSFGKNTLIGHYYTYDSDLAGAASNDADGIQVAIQHQMNDQLRLWADLRLDDADGVGGGIDDVETTTLSLGARYDFSITN
ncbi:porin [Pelagibaculum spongiae]|uniref:Porin domain-containing protein n=1 Tax=Pelagibaculum spongiae TaxID=2080658 RepID=A0A2V1H544_9GAMM|nr:porin [Pelagibaculum spongiae]PVZ72327.1 hypothetical protein DC094_04790 [Pelagibaculum spongiae]